MSNSELKLDLIPKIIDTNNVDLLMKIKTVLENSSNSTHVLNEPTTTYQKTKKNTCF